MQTAAQMKLTATSGSMRVQTFGSASLRPARLSVGRSARRRVVVRAEAEGDDDFEARLAALKRAKGETPYGEGKKAQMGKEGKTSSSSSSSKPTTGRKKNYDYTNECVHFETSPHLGDVAVNVALGITLVWLPLSLAAVGRGAFVKYRFTDRRISCITNAPWKNEQLDAAYQEVKDVVTIGRGVGIWGDMLITLRDGSKIEMRALPKFLEMKEYILKRRDELTGGTGGAGGGGGSSSTEAEARGFA